MATLHTFEPRHRPVPPAAFTRRELSQMLSVYSRRVADGEWRDYAIDSRDGKAIFSIFRNSLDKPAFAIVKQPDDDDGEYALFAGPERLEARHSLPDLLAAFEARPRLIQG
ncbi:MAG TPA: DUF2794 domain-containing protein [Alphaproteobacteria bacterium]|nr:DUF2794 domain-containing protein [Alphaproteobacteria bacterium]